jgi:quercetin dioxygenase-like cupin family protein
MTTAPPRPATLDTNPAPPPVPPGAFARVLLPPELEALPWQPIRPGFSLKVLHGGEREDDTRALLLRLEPGTTVSRHRHGGEVHALNLRGSRRILETGEVIGPGGYVHEPPGNVDSWMAVGDEPVEIFLTVRGAIEALDELGAVAARTTTPSITADWRAFLAESGRR